MSRRYDNHSQRYPSPRSNFRTEYHIGNGYINPRPTDSRDNKPAKSIYTQELLSMRNKSESHSRSEDSESSGEIERHGHNKQKDAGSRNRYRSSSEDSDRSNEPRRSGNDRRHRDESSGSERGYEQRYKKRSSRHGYENSYHRSLKGKKNQKNYSSQSSSGDDNYEKRSRSRSYRESPKRPTNNYESLPKSHKRVRSGSESSEESVREVERLPSHKTTTRESPESERIRINTPGKSKRIGIKPKIEELVMNKKEKEIRKSSDDDPYEPVSRDDTPQEQRNASTADSGSSREAKLHMLCTMGLVKENEKNALPNEYIDEIWDAVCKVRKEKINSEMEKLTPQGRLEQKIKMAVDGRISNMYPKADEILSSQREAKNGKGRFPDYANKAGMKTPTIDIGERKQVADALTVRERQIQLLKEELETVERAIEKQFRVGRGERDEEVLSEQMRLGAELKSKISHMQRDREALKAKLVTPRSPVKPETSSHKLNSSSTSDMGAFNGGVGGADSDNAAVMLDLQFDYYDGGRHYCRMCDDTSNTIIHFLTHLHSTKHREIASVYGDRPWTKLRESKVERRTGADLSPEPISGTEFVIPTLGFFCKLCCEFSGDVADCENHVMSERHNRNYREHLKKNKSYEQKLRLERKGSWQQISRSKSRDKPKQIDELSMIQSPESVKHETKEIYDDAFGLNKLVDESVKKYGKHEQTRKARSNSSESDSGDNKSRSKSSANKSKKNFAEEVAGKPNFTVTINRSDDEEEMTQPSEPRGNSGVRRDEKEVEKEESDDGEASEESIIGGKWKEVKPPSEISSRKSVEMSISKSKSKSSPSPSPPPKAFRTENRIRSESRSPSPRRRSRSRSASRDKRTYQHKRYYKSPPRYNYGYQNSRYNSDRHRDHRNRDPRDNYIRNRYSRSRSDSRRRQSSNSEERNDRKRQYSPKRKRSPSSASSEREQTPPKRIKRDLNEPISWKTELVDKQKEPDNAQTMSSFALKKISLALTGNDQYFTEESKDKQPKFGFMEVQPSNEDLDPAKRDNKESISFSISKEDKLKKQILETKIFSQIHKPKTNKSSNNSESQTGKMKSFTGKKSSNNPASQQAQGSTIPPANAPPATTDAAAGFSGMTPIGQLSHEQNYDDDPPPPGME